MVNNLLYQWPTSAILPQPLGNSCDHIAKLRGLAVELLSRVDAADQTQERGNPLAAYMDPLYVEAKRQSLHHFVA